MWTPKRIVLLALGFFVFFSGYMLYSTALGGIDGLPPLPAADLPRDPGQGPVGPLPSHGLKLEDKLAPGLRPGLPGAEMAPQAGAERQEHGGGRPRLHHPG